MTDKKCKCGHDETWHTVTLDSCDGDNCKCPCKQFTPSLKVTSANARRIPKDKGSDTLSDKGFDNTEGDIADIKYKERQYGHKDLKEAIKKLKYKVEFSEDKAYLNRWIDKIFGDDLI